MSRLPASGVAWARPWGRSRASAHVPLANKLDPFVRPEGPVRIRLIFQKVALLAEHAFECHIQVLVSAAARRQTGSSTLGPKSFARTPGTTAVCEANR